MSRIDALVVAMSGSSVTIWLINVVRYPHVVTAVMFAASVVWAYLCISGAMAQGEAGSAPQR